MSLLVATQITAVATAVLAIGAIVTAILAGLAFRKQAQEVQLLGRQIEDQQILSAQQGQAIALQSEQLALNRKQLAEQQRDLSQRARILERQQANAIDLVVWPTGFFPDAPNVCTAMISNGSDRPIREVRCRIELGEKRDPHFMTWLGVRIDHDWEKRGMWERFGDQGSDSPIMRPKSTHGFEFAFGREVIRPWAISVRFTDDADLHWHIDPFLHLEQLETREDW